MQLSIQTIEQAHNRIKPYFINTPIKSNKEINDLVGADIYFKCENLQHSGSFKLRGASNAVFSLNDQEAENGVITVSSGNHGAALSMAVTRRGGKTKVVMPHNTPKIKVKNVERNGGEVVWCEPDQPSREQVLADLVSETDATVVHPYNDERIVAGQGTCAKELLEDYPEIQIIVSPVSGGGLLSGTLLSAKEMNEQVSVYGAEPAEADDAYRSLQNGEIVPNETINTICDGLRAQIGTITFPIIQKYVDEIITLSEEEILDSMKMIWERLKIIVEPSCSISLAAIIKNKNKFSGKNVGLIMSGGNVDLNQLPW